MVDCEQLAREQDADLRELAELGMAFARKLEARVDLAANVAETQALALAFNRIARGVRLTHALRTRLVRDHLEIGKLERTAKQRAAERRKTQITAVLDREIFTEERDQDEADSLSERLTERLDHEVLFDEFLDGTVETAVARFREDIGLAEAGAEQTDPPPGRSPIKGEVDRAFGRETEGVEAHSDLRGLQPPQSTASTAPREGKQLESLKLKPVPS